MQKNERRASDNLLRAGARSALPDASQERSPFDPDWYLAAYSDVAQSGLDPYEHYVSYGRAEGRHPTQVAAEEAVGFDRAWYLAAYPDVAASGQDPYLHWLGYGKGEGRQVSGNVAFSPSQLAVLAKSYHFKKTGQGVEASSEPTQPDSLSSDPSPEFDSAQYWRDRYRTGGTSGAGSYGRLAQFKAEVINEFVREHGIASVMEFGCGDGAQLSLADYPAYVGFDVANESVELCRSRFAQDSTKQFRNAQSWSYERAQLTLSLDVIYHLVEDDVFHDYMRRLFFSAERYVIVYSSNHESGHIAAHVKHRKFTEWVDIYHSDFRLVRYVPNRWPLVDDDQDQSFADFYIFERQPSSKHTLPGRLVVSLTSYPPRYPTLELTLRRILQQSVQPDETVLWVSHADRQQLPEGVLALQHSGLAIRETRDIRSYKKIIPALERYPDSFIVTFDDDLAYPLDTIEVLVTNYRGNEEILCRRAHKVTFSEDENPRPYIQWQFETEQETGVDLFPTGGAGTLYPPHSLASDVTDEATFTSLAPLADDVWLFWMARRAGSAVRRVGPRYALRTWPGCDEQGLFLNHNVTGGNDPVIAALVARYGSPFKPGFARASSAVGEAIHAGEHPKPHHLNTPRPRFRMLRCLVRPFARPLLRALAGRFMPRAEVTENTQALGAQLRELGEALASIERSLAQVRQEAHDQLTQVRQEARNQFTQVRQEIGDQVAEVRVKAGELNTAMTGIGGRVNELEKSASFNRQAIHDLGQELLSGTRGMVPTTPGVGVVIATCDRPMQLRAALESLAAQTRKPEIVVVVNDGHEKVDEICRHFAGRLQIFPLRTPTPRSGSSVARNIALDALQTSLVAFLDDDNLMWPYWIEKAAALLENDETLDMIYGAQLRDSEISGTDKSWFLVPFDLDRLRRSNFIDMNQLMHRASDARFDTRMRRLVDWDYVLKLIDRLPGRIAPVDAISSIYSTSSPGRITVVSWPPDLSDVASSRRNRLPMSMPEGCHACPCGYQGVFLQGPNGRPEASCPRCGSLERHRFLGLLAPLLRSFWIPSSRPRSDTSMVEVAPSGATQSVRDMYGRVVTVDADPQADGRMVDVVASLTDLPMSSATCDLALVLHVLEHIPDDQAAMREIARVLRPSGIAIVQVPLSNVAMTDEEVLDSPQARQARYGQADHVRLYGQDFLARLSSAGLSIVSITPRHSMPQEAIEKHALQADEALILAVRSDSAWAKARLEELAAMLRKGAF